mmetsp:Transcript_7369/g.8459  ORF Transcript_7369/g.8459 Transcript_7369/m.8459 type:complete len:351 (+) Transcript_7369:130-1182(+)
MVPGEGKDSTSESHIDGSAVPSQTVNQPQTASQSLEPVQPFSSLQSLAPSHSLATSEPRTSSHSLAPSFQDKSLPKDGAIDQPQNTSPPKTASQSPIPDQSEAPNLPSTLPASLNSGQPASSSQEKVLDTSNAIPNASPELTPPSSVNAETSLSTSLSSVTEKSEISSEIAKLKESKDLPLPSKSGLEIPNSNKETENATSKVGTMADEMDSKKVENSGVSTSDANGTEEENKNPDSEEMEVSDDVKPEDLIRVVHKYEPLIPVPVVKHYLERAGCEMIDDDHVRIIALAAQKLIGDVVSDARIRIVGKTPIRRRGENLGKEEELKLTTADLKPCLAGVGVPVRKPEFYS